MTNNVFFKTLAAVSTVGIVVITGIQVKTGFKKSNTAENQLAKTMVEIKNARKDALAEVKSIRSEVLKNGVSFWLNWKNDIILKRIINSKKRPKLDFLNDKGVLKLINLRSKIYFNADCIVNCDNLNKFQIAKKILKIYENKTNFS